LQSDQFTTRRKIMAKSGSETIGAAGDKSKMTLFKDDRAEDIGAIIVSVLVIATVMVLNVNKAAAPSTASIAAPASAVSAPAAAPGAGAETAKK
jgi:hypothetical protein